MTAFFETERLTLRPPVARDLDFLSEMNQDPDVMAFMPSLMNREESERQLRRMSRHFQDWGFGIWLIERRNGGEPLGLAGLQKVDFEAPFAPAVEVAWRLVRSQWGNGYASEAARAALRFGFEALGLPEIVGFTTAANERSIAVFRRIGMPRDSAFDFEHPKLEPHHPLRPHVFFRLTRESAQSQVARVGVSHDQSA